MTKPNHKDVVFEYHKPKETLNITLSLPDATKLDSLQRKAKKWAGISNIIGKWEQTSYGMRFTTPSLDAELRIVQNREAKRLPGEIELTPEEMAEYGYYGEEKPVAPTAKPLTTHPKTYDEILDEELDKLAGWDDDIPLAKPEQKVPKAVKNQVTQHPHKIPRDRLTEKEKKALDAWYADPANAEENRSEEEILGEIWAREVRAREKRIIDVTPIPQIKLPTAEEALGSLD